MGFSPNILFVGFVPKMDLSWNGNLWGFLPKWIYLLSLLSRALRFSRQSVEVCSAKHWGLLDKVLRFALQSIEICSAERYWFASCYPTWIAIHLFDLLVLYASMEDFKRWVLLQMQNASLIALSTVVLHSSPSRADSPFILFFCISPACRLILPPPSSFLL